MGRRSRVALLLAVVGSSFVVVGCSLSPSERQEIIDTSAEVAAERASTWALIRAREAGVGEEDALRVAGLAREEARRGAAEVAARLTPRAEARASEKKRSKVGAFLAAFAVALVQVLAGVSRRAIA